MMATATAAPQRTNGHRVAERLEGVRQAVGWAVDCPDELAVFALPVVAAALISLRHRLPFPEHMLICELGGLAGIAALRAYVEWKDQPAPTLARVKGIK